VRNRCPAGGTMNAVSYARRSVGTGREKSDHAAAR
jgi:hypothetical protein